jgi:hypothetical protein
VAQRWTEEVLKLLPAKVSQINADPTIRRMNERHHAERVRKGSYANPINSMAYDTLKRLQRQGKVVREEDGTYRLS